MTAHFPASELPPRETLETLGRFVAAMAHEINNPLGALVMNAEVAAMLLERGRTAELPAILRQIQTDAMRCAAEVRGMADVAMPARDSSPRFALADALAAIHQRVSARAGRDEESLQFDVPAPLPQLAGNRNAIEYALEQLARRVFASGARRVRVVATALDDGIHVQIASGDDHAAIVTGHASPRHAPQADGQDAVIDIARCLLAGSRAVLGVAGEARQPVFDVHFPPGQAQGGS